MRRRSLPESPWRRKNVRCAHLRQVYDTGRVRQRLVSELQRKVNVPRKKQPKGIDTPLIGVSTGRLVKCPSCGDEREPPEAHLYKCVNCEKEGFDCCVPGTNAICTECEEAEEEE